MKKEERIENERQMKESKINGLMAKMQTEKERVQEKISELEKKRPGLYAKVVLRQAKASERDKIEVKLQRLQDKEKRLSLTIRGFKEMLKELEGLSKKLTYYQEDRGRFEELKGFIKEAERFRPMWDREVRQFGEQKARRVLIDYSKQQTHLMRISKYITELDGLAKELDEEPSLREFIQETTGETMESLLGG